MTIHVYRVVEKCYKCKKIKTAYKRIRSKHTKMKCCWIKLLRLIVVLSNSVSNFRFCFHGITQW